MDEIEKNISIDYSNLVLDFCFGSLICNRGQCVNSVEGFTCLCPIFFDGIRCEKCKQNFVNFDLTNVILRSSFSLMANLTSTDCCHNLCDSWIGLINY
jgi:hypothetical protein